jgi:hypothetical protein
MVDFESYLQHMPEDHGYGPIGDARISPSKDDECRCRSCSSNEDLQKNQRIMYDGVDGKTEFLDNDQYLICPPRVLGYHLGSRTWLELDISEIPKTDGKRYLQDIIHLQSNQPFEKLELNSTMKSLIKDLVQGHTSSTGKPPPLQDIMKEKGRGLVILLHGMCTTLYLLFPTIQS